LICKPCIDKSDDWWKVFGHVGHRGHAKAKAWCKELLILPCGQGPRTGKPQRNLSQQWQPASHQRQRRCLVLGRNYCGNSAALASFAACTAARCFRCGRAASEATQQGVSGCALQS
jgi:hypothetical protein